MVTGTSYMARRRKARAKWQQNNRTGGLLPEPTFFAPLTTSLIPARNNGSGTPTYSRASAAYVQDHEGVLRQVLANEARFWGARRVRNLFAATTALSTQSVTVGAGRITVSFTGTGSITFTGAFTGSLAGTGAASRVQTTFTTTAGTLTCTVAGSVTFAQCEDVTGQSVETMSEYVSVGVLSSPWQGANVDGVQYFDTTLAGVPIPATTALGYLAEAAGTQLVTPTAAIRNIGDAAWVSSGGTVTRAQTSIGVDGVPNSATRVTATGASAVLLQAAPVTAAGNYCTSFYIRRVTGTGNIDITVDGGTTWSTISGQINSATYTRVQVTGNLALNTARIGLRIATNGDAVDVDFAQMEAGAGATTAMASAGAARNGDALSYPALSNFTPSAGAAYCEFTTGAAIPANTYHLYPSMPVLAIGGGLSTFSYDNVTFADSGVACVPNTSYRQAAAWGGSTFSNVRNGAVSLGLSKAFAGTLGSAAGSLPVNQSGSNQFQTNGTVRNLRIYSQKLTDAQLAAMVA